MTDMIRTSGLVKRYGKVVALDGLDLAVPKGTVLGLLGPNGAGKTTAVRILTTLLDADEGRAEVAGLDVRADPHGVRERITEIGWMVLPPFQGRGLATEAVGAVLEKARSESRWDAVHAFPPVSNAPSNAICRKMGFSKIGEGEFTFRDRVLRCNRWRLAL